MFRRALITWTLLGTLVVLSAPLWAAGPDLLDKGVERYEFAEFKEAARLLKQALQSGDLGASQKARAYAYLGLVSLAQGDRRQSVKYFGQAKAADPAFRLDPKHHPAKAVALYTRAAVPKKPPKADKPLSKPAPGAKTAPAKTERPTAGPPKKAAQPKAEKPLKVTKLPPEPPAPKPKAKAKAQGEPAAKAKPGKAAAAKPEPGVKAKPVKAAAAKPEPGAKAKPAKAAAPKPKAKAAAKAKPVKAAAAKPEPGVKAKLTKAAAPRPKAKAAAKAKPGKAAVAKPEPGVKAKPAKAAAPKPKSKAAAKAKPGKAAAAKPEPGAKAKPAKAAPSKPAKAAAVKPAKAAPKAKPGKAAPAKPEPKVKKAAKTKPGKEAAAKPKAKPAKAAAAKHKVRVVFKGKPAAAAVSKRKAKPARPRRTAARAKAVRVKKAAPKPRVRIPSNRGYVVDVTGKEITLDLGRRHGVQLGDRFVVEQVTRYRHPATKERLVKRRRRGVVLVTEVYDQLSTARALRGLRRIRAGHRLRWQPKPKGRPPVQKAKARAPAPRSKARAAKGGRGDKTLRLAVLPPLVEAMGVTEFEGAPYQAAPLIERLNRLPRLQAFVPNGAQQRALAEINFNPARYILFETFSMSKLSHARKVRSQHWRKLLSELEPHQVAYLAKVMDLLKADGLLIWQVWPNLSGSEINFSLNLHLRGESNPRVRTQFYLHTYQAAELYPLRIATLLQKVQMP